VPKSPGTFNITTAGSSPYFLAVVGLVKEARRNWCCVMTGVEAKTPTALLLESFPAFLTNTGATFDVSCNSQYSFSNDLSKQYGYTPFPPATHSVYVMCWPEKTFTPHKNFNH